MSSTLAIEVTALTLYQIAIGTNSDKSESQLKKKMLVGSFDDCKQVWLAPTSSYHEFYRQLDVMYSPFKIAPARVFEAIVSIKDNLVAN